MTRKWYEYGDAAFIKLRQRITRAFNISRLTLPFDEINQGKISLANQWAAVLYRRLKKLNRKCFEDIFEYVYYAAWREVKPGQNPKKLPDKWLDKFMNGYNPVTKYVYEHEIGRKQSRFFEAIVADAENNSRHGMEDDYKKSERYWRTMSEQYCIDVEDAAAEQAYRDAGVKRVMWISERDDRVCDECMALNGLVFSIDKVPSKPHYGCRCRIVPALGRN